MSAALPLQAVTLTLSAREDSLMDEVGAAVLKEAYQRLGHNIIIEQRPGLRALHEGNSGASDGVVMRLEKVLRENLGLYKISVPIWNFEVAVFTKKNFPAIENWKDLEQTFSATYRGYKYVESRLKKQQHVLVSSFDTGMQMLQMGRFDTLVYGRLDGLRAVKSINGQGIACHSGIEKFPEFHMVHRRHKNLIIALEKVLTEMKANGRLKEIQDHVLQEKLGDVAKLCETRP